MPLEAWIVFALLSVLVLAIPGPLMRLVLSYALGGGFKSALASVCAVGLGNLAIITANLFAFDVLFKTMPRIFMALTWLGGLYLIWQAVILTHAWYHPKPVADNDNLQTRSWFGTFRHVYHETLFRPKNIMFMMAFIAQFFDPFWPLYDQISMISLTFLSASIVVTSVYAGFARTIIRLVRRPVFKRKVTSRGKTILIATSAVTAGYRRAAA